MRVHEHRDFAPLDGVHDFAELLAYDIQPAADLVDPVDVGETARGAKGLEESRQYAMTRVGTTPRDDDRERDRVVLWCKANRSADVF